MNKVAYIVTGVSGALGGGLARKLIAEGEKVIGLSLDDPQIAGVSWHLMDLADEISIETVVDEVKAEINDDERLFLINAAGVMDRGEIVRGEIERVYKVNVMGVIYLTNLLLDKIKETGGDVLNVSSTAGTKGSVNYPVYSSSKWAIRGYTKSLQELFQGTSARAIDFAIGGFISGLFEVAGRDNQHNQSEWIPTEDAVDLLYTVIRVPKTIQISEIIAARKGINAQDNKTANNYKEERTK